MEVQIPTEKMPEDTRVETCSHPMVQVDGDGGLWRELDGGGPALIPSGAECRGRLGWDSKRNLIHRII
uniref:Uncharacterized protein K0007B01.26 n=1 Tax=Oryza sativa subsp. indica TaxID=39946 RepID=C8TET1_ORYSI|nr:hypothetical protein [Oryza sativa Indica Group]BAI39758.1 hypothetical protein [Oryza sativa Indica Group]